MKFGLLTVSHRVPHPRKWACVCACGNKTAVRGDRLNGGRARSCGCRKKRHGLTGTPIHGVWMAMRYRCESPKCHAYGDYGGRGIKVCDRWQEFENFYADMGPSYRAGLTLERINNDAGYHPENCKWATRAEQNRNRRRFKPIDRDSGDYVFGCA